MLGLALLEKEDYTGAISELGKVSLSLLYSSFPLLSLSLSFTLTPPSNVCLCRKSQKLKDLKCLIFIVHIVHILFSFFEVGMGYYEEYSPT